MSSAVVGIARENLVADVRTMLDEMQGIEIEAIARDSNQLFDYVQRFEPDLVLVHEMLGPEPAPSIIRDLTVRRPEAAVVQISPERSSTTVIRAMEAGARGVVSYPFTFEDFVSRVNDALDWAEHMQRVLAGSQAGYQSGRGRVQSFVGAKGGVGVTTLAVHHAINHHHNAPNQRVCVVDLDIEKGDLSALLDVRGAVSVADLAKVYQDLSAQTVNDAVIHHETGVHLLLAPVDVRQSEAITPEALRAIVALLRREFDVVVLDAGGYVSPTQGSAVELADDVVIVTSPDVLSMRAMRKRLLAWEALGVRHEAEFQVLLNKVDKSSIFPADAVAKLTTAKVLQARVPLSTRTLEPAVNERDPRAVADANWWKLMTKVGSELGLGLQPLDRVADSPPQPTRAAGRRLLTSSSQRGAATVELVGILPLILFTGLLVWQLAVSGLGYFWLGQASNEATRTYAITGSTVEATESAKESVPPPFREGVSVTGSDSNITVRLALPDKLALVSEFSSQHVVIKEPS